MPSRDNTMFQRWPEQLREKRGLFNGQRVKVARESRGMARYALARKLGIPAKELEKREADWCFWAEDEAALLTGFTNYPIGFFVQDDLPAFRGFMCGHDEDDNKWCEIIGMDEEAEQ